MCLRVFGLLIIEINLEFYDVTRLFWLFFYIQFLFSKLQYLSRQLFAMSMREKPLLAKKKCYKMDIKAFVLKRFPPRDKPDQKL